MARAEKRAAARLGAVQALYELDLLTKGIALDGSPRSLSEDRSNLALLAWIGAHANPRR